ncbi:MAG: hypothetical protein ACT6TH_02600 [Brevundimonas sp.]|uniref:hypothetical protein n=1 Tax=Brevundimonas sp. TaxID=1871086 RepID=UPI004033D4DE
MTVLAMLAAVLALSAGGQDAAPQDPPETRLDDVVVDGRTLRELVRDFTSEVVAPPVGRGPARWDQKVCVGVANLRREAAQVIVDRVSAIALEVGLEIGEPGCSPNILILASEDGKGAARALVEAAPRAFRPGYAGASRSVRQLELFQDSDAAVRWWHVSLPTMSDTRVAAVRLPGEAAPYIYQDGSRLTTRIQNDLRRAFVVVDLSKMEGITFQQLGDYVGMVAMAQIDPDADTRGYDTILNLFDTDRRVSGATQWDVSYLGSLYDAEFNARRAEHQVGRVASAMTRDQERERRQTTDEDAE